MVGSPVGTWLIRWMGTIRTNWLGMQLVRSLGEADGGSSVAGIPHLVLWAVVSYLDGKIGNPHSHQ